MRLLDCKTLQLEEFYDSEIPAYAILSHTWDKAQEVSYQDLQALNSTIGSSRPAKNVIDAVQAKRGYDKIVQSARLALANGSAYIWIDTCCIDKTSSANLSEAVNSMYRWYADSSVCYAYLADVFQEEALEEQLTKSRW